MVTIISQREESEAPWPISTPNPRTNKQQQIYGWLKLTASWGRQIRPIIFCTLITLSSFIARFTSALLYFLFTIFWLCTNIIALTIRLNFDSFPIQFETFKNDIQCDEFSKIQDLNFVANLPKFFLLFFNLMQWTEHIFRWYLASSVWNCCCHFLQFWMIARVR